MDTPGARVIEVVRISRLNRANQRMEHDFVLAAPLRSAANTKRLILIVMRLHLKRARRFDNGSVSVLYNSEPNH